MASSTYVALRDKATETGSWVPWSSHEALHVPEAAAMWGRSVSFKGLATGSLTILQRVYGQHKLNLVLIWVYAEQGWT